MGRHSVSYIAAQQRLSGPMPSNAGSFVGRVGGLAVALGVGAAIMSAAGIAHAEGPADSTTSKSPTDASPSPSTSAATTSDTTPRASTTASGGTAASGTVGAGAHPAGSVTVPTMHVGNGRSSGDQPPATTRQESLPEVIASIPQKVVAALTPHPSGEQGSSPTITTTKSASPVPPSTEAPTPSTPTRPHSTASDGTPPPRPDPTPQGPTVDAPPTARPVAAKAVQVAAVSVASVPVASGASSPAVAQTITPTQVSSAPPNPIAMVVANVLTALGIPSSATNFGGSPVTPFPILQAALLLVHREIENLTYGLTHIFPTVATPTIPTNPVPSTVVGVPTPADEASTPYGDIGKWMLESNGQISNYGGLPHDGKTVLEPVNVIIVDPTSSSAAESALKLNTAMFWSGFPAQPIHTTGFQGRIDDVTYGQQPTGPFLGFSDSFFLFDNDHGRIFGPDPVETDKGYVWSGAFSRETLVLNGLIPAHAYVSSNVARNALAMRLIASGQATYGGMVPLHNAYDTQSTTTGDHDGYAVVVILK